jgi:ABC-type transport system substrate-binding protein
VAPADASAEEFARGDLDEFVARDRREAPLVREALPGAPEAQLLAGEGVLSTLFTGAPPWDNPMLRRALSGALNRQWLVDVLFAGRAGAAGPVAPVFAGFDLAEAELGVYPGYLAEDPEADAQDARAAWDAAGGPGLGPVRVDFPSIFDPAYSASAVVAGRLGAVLGAEVVAAVEPYTAIARKVSEHRYGNGEAALWFGWGPRFVGPDPSAWLSETYRSSGPARADLGPGDAGVDAILDALVAEGEMARREALARDVAIAVLGAGGLGVIDWAVQRFEHFASPRLEGRVATAWPAHHLEAALTARD